MQFLQIVKLNLQNVRLIIQIIMLGFPAHTTHILQPLDVGIFNHVKKRFSQLCITAGRLDSRARITKHYFPQTWNTALKSATTAVIRSAFERAGIYPFDPTAVDDSKIKKYKSVLLCKTHLYCHSRHTH